MAPRHWVLATLALLIVQAVMQAWAPSPVWATLLLAASGGTLAMAWWAGRTPPAPEIIEEAPPEVGAPVGLRALDGLLIDFDAVVGQDDAKQRLREAITIAQQDTDIRSAGVLLHGPSGSGKTFLLRAAAGQTGWPAYELDLGALGMPYDGSIQASIDQTFAFLAGRAPCWLFIEDLDAHAPDGDTLDVGMMALWTTRRTALAGAMAKLHQDNHPFPVVVATATHLSRVHPQLRVPGTFGDHVALTSPGHDDVAALLKRSLSPLDADGFLSEVAKVFAGEHRTSGWIVNLSRAVKRDAAVRSDSTLRMEALMARADKAAEGDEPPPGCRLIDANVDYSDYIGGDALKQDMERSVRMIQHPERAKALGVEPDRGILLHGPPGTGKTYFARCTAGQFDLHFLAVGNVRSKWFGETEQHIHDVFAYARRHAPCLLFFDEFDALAPARDAMMDTASPARSTVNALLAELDGIHGGDDDPIVMAATNHLELIDAAVLRPGRLGRHVLVPPSTPEDAIALLQHGLPDTDIEWPSLRAVIGTQPAASIAEVVRQVKDDIHSEALQGKATPPRRILLRDVLRAMIRVFGAHVTPALIARADAEAEAYGRTSGHDVGGPLAGEVKVAPGTPGSFV